MKKLILCALLASAAVSANDYAKFYKPLHRDGVQPEKTSEDTELANSVGDVTRDGFAMWERGFGPIGRSSFNGQMRKDTDALGFGKKIGARYVIVYSAHTGTRTGAISTPLLGSFVTMPITQERFDQGAIYYAPVPAKGLGVMIAPLTDEQKSSLGTNKGFVVRAIRKGSPAYDANLVPGDVVTSVNGKPADIEELVAVAKVATDPVHVGILRGGQAKDVQLTMPESWR